jgi:hypothetical protein
MVLPNWLMDGLVFTSGDFFLYQGAFTRVPHRPAICDKCDSLWGCFHAWINIQLCGLTLRVKPHCGVLSSKRMPLEGQRHLG